MRCDTCKKDCPLVLRVMVAKDYNRSLARPLFNCPACFDKKAQGRDDGLRRPPA
jgi:hypothetical protein